MSITKNQIKLVNSLKLRKFRQKHSLFIAEGPKVCADLLQAGIFEISEIYALPQYLEQLKKPLPKQVFSVNERELAQISQLKTPNQVLCLVNLPDISFKSDNPNIKSMLVLDGINDPGNMGTIIRTADWFGFKHLLCTKDCVDVFHPKVVQSTMGAIQGVKILYEDAEAIKNQLLSHDFAIYGAFLEGEDVYQHNFKSKPAFIIGSESHGIRLPLKDCVQQKLKIPGNAVGHFSESLNASIAAGIFMSEYFRKS